MTQITPQVEDVLRRSRVEGDTLFLPPDQLDRKLYEAVNDVLARLVAIAPGGFAFRDDRRVAEFRGLVDAVGGRVDLPPGSFTVSGTEVSTVLLWMDA